MSNTNERPVLTDVIEGIATVTLNKPWKLNAWDTPMRAEIAEVLRLWNKDTRVRAVVMTGAGRFVEVQGTGEEATFGDDELAALLSLAKRGIREIREKQKATLGDVWPWA